MQVWKWCCTFFFLNNIIIFIFMSFFSLALLRNYVRLLDVIYIFQVMKMQMYTIKFWINMDQTFLASSAVKDLMLRSQALITKWIIMHLGYIFLKFIYLFLIAVLTFNFHFYKKVVIKKKIDCSIIYL